MTSPGGLSGITPGPIQQLFSITGGATGTNIPGLEGLTQTPVEDALKQMYVLENEAGVGGPLGLVYNGLRAGVSLPLALAEAVVKQVLGLDDSTVFFNIEHALTTLYDGLLGAFKPPELGDGLPLTLPFTLAAPKPPMTKALQNLLRMLGNPNFTAAGFDPQSAVKNLITLLFKPSGLLAWLEPGGDGVMRLAESLAPEKLLEFLEGILAIPTGLEVTGNLWQDAVSWIGSIFGVGNQAQSTGNTNSAQIAILLAERAAAAADGSAVLDDFNRAAAGDLGTAYEQVYSGAGSGVFGTDGAGNGHWYQSGGASRRCLNRHVTALASDTQSAWLVLPTPPVSALSSSYIEIMLRMNLAKTAFVDAVIWPNAVEIGFVVSGVYTRIGDTVPVAMAAGDRWEFRAGVGGNLRRYVLLQNDVTVCDRTETATSSLYGPDYLHTGFAATAGVSFYFFVASQFPSPDVAAFAAADRAA